MKQAIATVKKTKEIQEKYKVFTKKSFGQNFIIEPGVVEKIANAAIQSRDELVFEIGPGIGALTQFLCEKSDQVVAFEIDEEVRKIVNECHEKAKEVINAHKVELERIAAALELDKKETKKIIENLMKDYEKPSIGMKIIELDGAYQMCTKSEMYEYLIRIAKQPKKHVLTDVLLETLSIIAYKQPITKVEIEKIRGVSCDHAVNKLVEYNLVKELGRLDAPGRPLLFGTTEEFLRSFGVQSLDELPMLDQVQIEEFKQEAEEEMKVKLDI